MEDSFRARVRELKLRMQGRWKEFLLTCGIDDKILSGRNGPCPMCGGKDRFQFTDKFQQGNFHCRGCGAGNGFSLLEGVLGWTFADSIGAIEKYLGSAPAPAAHHDVDATGRMRELARSIWAASHPVAGLDPVDGYLRARGLQLNTYPKVLRMHNRLAYYERDAGQAKSKLQGHHPAMVAAVQGPDGHVVTLHRTYLADGGKAPVADPKKLLSAGVVGASVRLFEPTDELALTEGIETALAVHLATGKPVWSAISAGNLERIVVPTGLRRVSIYADNDAGSKFDGQASAYILARRLRRETPALQVEVFTPREAGTDWADVWATRCMALKKAA